MCLVKQCIDDYDYVKLCERKVSVGKMSAMVIPREGGRCPGADVVEDSQWMLTPVHLCPSVVPRLLFTALTAAVSDAICWGVSRGQWGPPPNPWLKNSNFFETSDSSFLCIITLRSLPYRYCKVICWSLCLRQCDRVHYVFGLSVSLCVRTQ